MKVRRLVPIFVLKRLVLRNYAASAAKRAGRGVTLRSDWESIKRKVMEYALRHKFSEGTSHYDNLSKTTGLLVEYNYWHDNEWGDCTCDKCNSKRGKNLLGKLLVEIRDQDLLF